MEIDDDELEYCQLLRYCAKIDELEKRKETEKMNSLRIKQLESVIEKARNGYVSSDKVSYVFDPYTGQVSSNINKLGTHLCLTWTWFPLFDNDKYIGYFAGDRVVYVENGNFIREESVNSYFAKKLMRVKL